jgi:hypothetical protein
VVAERGTTDRQPADRPGVFRGIRAVLTVGLVALGLAAFVAMIAFIRFCERV